MVWEVENRTHPGLDPYETVSPKSCGWATVGVGTSDFLGLGSLRASFASSHPLPFTPRLFYCFITFFRAAVAKDSNGQFSTFSLYQTPSLAVLSSLVTCKGFPFRSKQIIETFRHVATFNFAELIHNNTEPSVNSNCHPHLQAHPASL